jgi:hypothetical protein
MKTKTLLSVLSTAGLSILGACVDATPTASEPEMGYIAQQLHDRGFKLIPEAVIPPEPFVAGESATAYSNGKGETALLISNGSLEERAMIFDATGTLEDTLTGEIANSWCESAFYWSCYGSCAPACWSDWGFGQGCHTDCNDACTWGASTYCGS